MLDGLFSDPDLKVCSSLCVRVRSSRSTCRLCQEACPSGAIQIREEGVFLSPNCTGCEICVPACPTGVFSRPFSEERKRRRKLKRSLQNDRTARFTCMAGMNSPEETVVAFPCLGGIPLAYLVAPFAWGANRIVIRRAGCGECPSAPGMDQYERILDRARRLLLCFGIPPDRIVEVDRSDPDAVFSSPEVPDLDERFGRREFLNLFRRRSLEVAVQLIPESEQAPIEGRLTQKESVKHSFLLELLPHLGEIRQNILSADILHVFNLHISESCIACNVCETLCPTGAIRREVNDALHQTRLLFSLFRCVGCGVCRVTCFPGAISLLEEVDLIELLRKEEKTLITVQAKPCRVCQMPFQGIPGDTCPQCLGSKR